MVYMYNTQKPSDVHFHLKELFSPYIYIAFLILFLGFPQLFFAQNLLNKRISISEKNERLEDVLRTIEDIGGFRFAYNIGDLPLDQSTSIDAKNERIRNILREILLPKETYEFEEVHQHIIISRVNPRPIEEKPLPSIDPPLPQIHLIKGQILHSETGHSIKGVIINSPQTRVSTKSNSRGNYQLSVSKSTRYVSLEIRHPSFHPQTINFTNRKDTNILIALQPIVISSIEVEPIDISPNPTPIADSVNRVEDVFLVKFFVKDALLQEDLPEDSIQKRPFQFSFLPILGTNGLKGGRTFNNISVNILAGYSAGLNGIEAAGLVNIERLDANGIQVAGLGNIVGGRSSGLQMAGLSNINRYSVSGFQFAGFNNYADSIKGGQISGFNNILRGQLVGVQATGGINFANGDIRGFEMAGIGNWTTKGVYGLQAAALFNAAKTIRGVQFSALGNVAVKEMSGLQLGTINVAGQVRGIQLGIVNVADTVVWGAPIGLINIIKNGYNHLEISTSDSFLGQLKLKMGVRYFHNVFAFSYHAEENDYRWAMGYGFSAELGLAKWLAINPGLLYYHVNQGAFTSRANELAQFNFNISVKVARRLQLFFGPNLNFHLSGKKEDGSPISLLAPAKQQFDFSSFNNNAQQNVLLYGWIGWQVGIRI